MGGAVPKGIPISREYMGGPPNPSSYLKLYHRWLFHQCSSIYSMNYFANYCGGGDRQKRTTIAHNVHYNDA